MRRERQTAQVTQRRLKTLTNRKQTESVQFSLQKRTVHQIISRQSKCILPHQENSHHALKIPNRLRLRAVIDLIIILEVSLEEDAMTTHTERDPTKIFPLIFMIPFSFTKHSCFSLYS